MPPTAGCLGRPTQPVFQGAKAISEAALCAAALVLRGGQASLTGLDQASLTRTADCATDRRASRIDCPTRRTEPHTTRTPHHSTIGRLPSASLARRPRQVLLARPSGVRRGIRIHASATSSTSQNSAAAHACSARGGLRALLPGRGRCFPVVDSPRRFTPSDVHRRRRDPRVTHLGRHRRPSPRRLADHLGSPRPNRPSSPQPHHRRHCGPGHARDLSGYHRADPHPRPHHRLG